MMKRTRQIGVLLLSAALLIGQPGATAYAEGPSSTGRLCEHHTAHDDACGYVEAVESHACEHEHTPECYTDELICGITEGDAQTASGSDAGHQHRQECYKPDCPHERGEHDDACGYIEGVKGTPCSYVCTECGGELDKDSGTISGNNPPAPVETAPGTVEPEDAGTIRVTAFNELGGGVKVQTVPKGTELESLNLPATLGASGYTVTADTEPVPEEITITGVTWELTGENNSPTVYEDGRETSCSYYFQPVLPEGYTLDQNAELPKIEVQYGWGTRANTDNYSNDDIAAINNIIQNNGLQGYNKDDPADWNFVGWDFYSPKRIYSLDLSGKSLTGTLDVSGLTQLKALVCYDNASLTGLTLGQNDNLNNLKCYNTGISGTLDVSGCSKLKTLWCYDNASLTALNLKQNDELTNLQCYNTGISGTLDVSGCPKLGLLRCDDNASLTELKLGQHNDLTGLQCYNTGISGTLDVSGCPQLTGLWCNNNTSLTGLTMGKHDNLTDLQCGNTGIRGTLDVSGCPKLGSLWCEDNASLTELKLGSHDDLFYLQCYNTGISDTLDVSGCPKLATLLCYDNASLTGLTLGKNDVLTDLWCDKTGISGTLDVSGCPNLKNFSYEGSSIKLKNGAINAGGNGKVKVQFGTIPVGASFEDVPFTLTALPDSGYHFTGWTGLPSGVDGNTAKVSFTPGTGYTYTASFTPSVVTIPVTGVTLDKPALTLTTGQTATLTATVEPANASNKTVKWKSSSHSVAMVDNGKVTAAAPGTATITVTTIDGGKEDTCTVTVKEAAVPVTGVTLDKPALTLTTGQTATLTATVEPANASNKTVKWKSSSHSVATVSNGTVTAAAPGKATITVTTIDGGKEDTCTVTVKEAAVPVTGVMLDKPALTLTTGQTATLTATVEPANASNRMVNWESSSHSVVTVSNGTVTAADPGKATITVTTTDGSYQAACIVTVNSPEIPDNGNHGNHGGGDDDNGTNHFTITTPEPPKPNNPVLAVMDLSVSVTEGKSATGTADDGRTAAALTEAGNKAGAKQNGITVRYDAKTSLSYDRFSITIKRATLDRLIENKVKYVTLNTGIVDLTFDLAALTEIQKQATGDITLTAAREKNLTGDALEAVGSRPAYRLAVNYTGADSKPATVDSFGAGRVAVGLAYTPAATEQTGSLYLVYSKDGQGAEWLYQSSYDRTGGNVISSVGHFSVYGVGYKPAPAFTDTVNHWAKADIDFVASRGLLTGTGNTTFTPDGTITRGMFVTALGRLAGIDPAAYPSSSWFADVPATAYYAPFVEWAAGKGIVSGTGEKTFSPDGAITREQIALMMQRYADQLGHTLPVAREAEIFADEGQITSGMKGAVQAMQRAGVMNGKGGHCFGPKDTATRAEAAAVLRRFVEVVIAPATADGWAQNDAGKWLYYENSKPVTGWKLIDSKRYYFDAAGLMQAGGWKEINGKWYYFYPDGAMAVNTTIDGCEIGLDGKRKDNN